MPSRIIRIHNLSSVRYLQNKCGSASAGGSIRDSAIRTPPTCASWRSYIQNLCLHRC